MEYKVKQLATTKHMYSLSKLSAAIHLNFCLCYQEVPNSLILHITVFFLLCVVNDNYNRVQSRLLTARNDKFKVFIHTWSLDITRCFFFKWIINYCGMVVRGDTLANSSVGARAPVPRTGVLQNQFSTGDFKKKILLIWFLPQWFIQFLWNLRNLFLIFFNIQNYDFYKKKNQLFLIIFES